MKVAIISIFRNNTEEYCHRYINRVKSLNYGSIEVRPYVTVGDSSLPSEKYLAAALPDISISIVHTGIKHYGSVVHPERFKCLALSYNAALDAAAKDGWADYVLYLDSDLLYASALLARLLAHQKEIIAPLIMAGPSFYDIWGFRKLDGDNFPSHPGWLKEKTEPFEILTAGAVVLFPAGPLYDGARLTEADAVQGLCHSLRMAFGLTIWCDPGTIVYHPVPGGPLTYDANWLQYPF